MNLLKNLITIFFISKILLKNAKGYRYKIKICIYFFNNLISRFIPQIKQKEDIFLKMEELDFYFSPRKSELSPYPEIFNEKIYEKVSNFIPKHGDIVFDVGSHIGFYTISSAKRCGNKGKVFCFEPNPDTFKRLNKNIKINGLSNVISNNIAISDKNGLIKLKIGESSEGSTIMKNGSLKSYYDDITIQSITLDEFVINQNIKNIDILKIDAEGAELLILKGAIKKTIPLVKKILIETHSVELKKACEKFLIKQGLSFIYEIYSGVNNQGECNLIYFSR